MVANVTAEQIEAKKARVAEALRLHDEGLSIKQTAERMGVAHETVRRYLRASGIPFVKKPTNKGVRKMPCGTMKHCPAFMRMLISDGVGTAEIAAALGCTASTVSNFKSRHGLSDSRKRLGRDDLDEIVARAESGESYYSIAADFGTTNSHISTIAIRNGIRRGKGGGCVARNNAARSSKAAPERMARVRDAIGESFEVVRETRKDWFLLRCRECGHEFERFVDLHYPTTCPECQRREAEQRAAERREREGKRALMQRLVNLLAYEHVCPECGVRFRSGNPKKLYCSTKCSNRAMWRRKSRRRGNQSTHVARAKRYGVEYDRSITLNRLIERDGMTCYLCGKTCTKDDNRWGSFGPDYPTIDHVIPLSKGGTHTWDNVRVACGICNELKGDEVISDPTPNPRSAPLL